VISIFPSLENKWQETEIVHTWIGGLITVIANRWVQDDFKPPLDVIVDQMMEAFMILGNRYAQMGSYLLLDLI
jgi:hypothetical protein